MPRKGPFFGHFRGLPGRNPAADFKNDDAGAKSVIQRRACAIRLTASGSSRSFSHAKRKRFWLAVKCIASPGVPEHTALDALPRPRFGVDPHSKVNPQRHAAGGRSEADVITKRAPQSTGENLAARRVDAAHPRHVALQLAVLDERCNGRFGREVALDVQQRSNRDDACNDRRGRDDVADA